MSQVVNAWTIGLILSLLALGVFISFRVFRFADITVDSSATLGAALSAVLLTEGWHPLPATLLAFVAGAAAGAVTGLLHTQFRINPLLSGILVMTGLYSINLRIMGKSNVPLGSATTLATYADRVGSWLSGGAARLAILGWEVPAAEVAMLLFSLVVCAAIVLALYAFFRTDLGTAMRATGDNDQMIRALGVNVEVMIIAGLALSNGLVALAGSLYAQKEGFADVQMGIGMIVWGLGSVIIGEALVGGREHVGLALIGAVMGSVLFRLMVALVLRLGLSSTDQKLITAVFVFAALTLPEFLKKLRAAVARRRGTDAAPPKSVSH